MNPKNRAIPKEHLVQKNTGLLNLKHQFKLHEFVIQISLFACGLLSIFTTLGIILVLGNESISFFTRDQWVNTNRAILSDMDDSATAFAVQPGNALDDIQEGDSIRIGQEVMEVAAFQNNRLTMAVAGTGGGFARWCAADETLAAEAPRPMIVNASRPIKPHEITACAAVGITPIPFQIGADALAIAVSRDNDFLKSVSFAELRQIFGEAEKWSDVRAEWPPEPIQLIVPDEDSGTFDFFVEEALDNNPDALLAKNPISSAHDHKLAGSISRDPFSIGFFGYAYYLAHADRLRILAVDGVLPAAETAASGYALSRPLFIYSDADIMRAHPQAADFISYYLTNVSDVIMEVGYFRASAAALEQAGKNWRMATGAGELSPVNPAEARGHLILTGSSTVFPLTERLGEMFVAAGYVPRFEVLRGARGEHTIAPHRQGAAVEYNDRPTILEFFSHTSWIPAIGEFGVIPLINATLMTSAIAILVALPLGIGAAVYLSEYAAPNIRNTLKPMLEILAGIPTVVYGYFALTFMTPLLRSVFGADVVNIYNTGSAGVVVGILIIPLISSMSEDALHAVPRALREASYGLGATKLETVVKVVIPAALSGILAAFIVAVSRAIGETMIVAIAAGAGPNFTFNPFDSAETMTGHIARISGGDLSYDSIDYNSIFAIGLTLFLMTFLLNVLSRVIISRFRETY